MKWLPLFLLAAGCADQLAPISSKVTLDGQTWTAAAFTSDGPNSQTVDVVLARELNADDCSWQGFDTVELTLLVGDRSMPHELDAVDVTTPFSGWVAYTDDDQNVHLASAGVVLPGRTVWGYSAEYGHNVVVEVDGEFDVTLADGRALGGAFSATSCEPWR
jgi:hypothetical protein